MLRETILQLSKAAEARIAELGAMLEVLSGGGMAQRP